MLEMSDIKKYFNIKALKEWVKWHANCNNYKELLQLLNSR